MKKLLILPVALACFALHISAAVPPAEKILPDDTLVMFTIPDFTKAAGIYNTAPPGQLWSDPALKAFKDKFMGKVKSEFLTPMEHDLGIHFDDYTSLPQGQLTFAMTQDGSTPKSDKPPGFLLLLDTKDKSGQLKTNLADLKKKWIDAGKTVKTEKIREVDFSVISLSSNDIPKSLRKLSSSKSSVDADAPDEKTKTSEKPADKAKIYIGQTDSLLVMGNSPTAIERVLSGVAGGSGKTLSDVQNYAGCAPMFRDAPMYCWVNAKTFVDLFSKMDDAPAAGGGDDAAPKTEAIMNALGFKGLKAIAFNYTYSSDGAQFNFMLNVPEDGRKGIFKILAGEAKEVKPPQFVPADAVKFQRWRIDGLKTWNTIQQMVGDANPQYVNTLNFLLSTVESSAKEKDPSFDIKKNLFGNIGDDMISYSKKPKGSSLAEMSSPPSLFLLGSPNPEQLSSALSGMLTMMGQGAAPTERDFLGRKIHSIPLPSMPTGGAKAEAKSINYASSGGYVAISTDTGILEEYLRSSQGDAKSLRDTPGLSEAMQKVVGAGTSLFGYGSEAETMRALFDFLKKDPSSAETLGGIGPLMGDVKIKEWVDVSLLPDFDKISKYFYFSVYSGGATPDGLVFKAFSPTPPQLRK